MTSQSPGNPNRDGFEIPLWESRDKKSFGCGVAERCREYYMGEGDDFLRVRVVVSLVSLEFPLVCPNTKGALKNKLTNLLVGLIQVRVSN